MTSARSRSARISFSMTTSPTSSNVRAATTFSASFSMTSWPRLSSATSTFGVTLTRSLRPPVKTSTVSSSLLLRKVPNPVGGWASRSTSSFNVMIWSRASRNVAARRSFWAVREPRDACVSASRCSRYRVACGASDSRRRSSATSDSKKPTWLSSSSAARDRRASGSCAVIVITSTGGPLLRPYLRRPRCWDLQTTCRYHTVIYRLRRSGSP